MLKYFKIELFKYEGMEYMKTGIEFSRKVLLAYSAMCKPLCKELGLPQTAFDILMFLANNPEYKTASDIVEMRHIKANLISVNVDRLVNDGYLERNAVKGDRRKTELVCTEKALPIVERGRQLQQNFSERIFLDADDEVREAFFSALSVMNKNLDKILEENC